MDIFFSQLDPRDHVRIFVGGTLQAEIAVGTVSDQTALADEVQAARALKALAHFVHNWKKDLEKVQAIPDHVNKTPAARQAAFCRGLEAGLCGTTNPHPFPSVPPVPPEDTGSYRRGYAHGDALRRALALVAQRGAHGDAP